MSFIASLKKTQHSLGLLLGQASKLSQQTLDQIEDILLQADCGINITDSIIQTLKHSRGSDWHTELENYLQKLFQSQQNKFDLVAQLNEYGGGKYPYSILVVGVNGAGKTTTIGKIAHLLNQHDKRAILVNADTFRAAASEQLTQWARRNGSEIITGHSKDPSAVIYLALEKSASRKHDVLIADTAGRQFNHQGLMQELEKMYRTINNFSSELPHQTWMVIDAGSGQNGIHQALAFQKIVPITGCIITKMDGTAKGGMILSIVNDLKIPVCYVGVGEKLEDLVPFDYHEFIQGFIPRERI